LIRGHALHGASRLNMIAKTLGYDVIEAKKAAWPSRWNQARPA
jgi:hypothetical protein